MATCLSTVSALESPDPRHDHKAVLALLVEGLVSPLPPLEDMRAPVRLRMGSFHERREQWARLTQQRVEAVPCLESLNVFERLDRIKAAATQAARESARAFAQADSLSAGIFLVERTLLP